MGAIHFFAGLSRPDQAFRAAGLLRPGQPLLSIAKNRPDDRLLRCRMIKPMTAIHFLRGPAARIRSSGLPPCSGPVSPRATVARTAVRAKK